MFSQTFVDGVQHTRKPYTVAVSTALQIAMICLLVLVPLLYTQTLPTAQLKSMLMAPPPPPPAPKPVVAKTHPAPAARMLQGSKLVAPAAVPKHVYKINDVPAAPALGGTTSLAEPGAGGNALLFASGDTGPPPPAFPPAKPKASGPVRIGGVVAEANIISRVQPIYPPLAKAARVEGIVEFTAAISKQGKVEKLRLLRGHPLLVDAARNAILQWQYRPTMLNGEPVDVLTTITVNFRLAH